MSNQLLETATCSAYGQLYWLWHLIVWENGSSWNAIRKFLFLMELIRYLGLLHTSYCYHWVLIVKAVFRHLCVFICHFLQYTLLLMNKVIAILTFLFCHHQVLICVILNECRNAIMICRYKNTKWDCINTKHHHALFISILNCLTSFP